MIVTGILISLGSFYDDSNVPTTMTATPPVFSEKLSIFENS